MMRTGAHDRRVESAYRRACRLDVEAYKPGNVSLFAAGHGMRGEDFLESAEASAAAMGDPRVALGERIFRAVTATRTAVGCNTNLGIILLAAPLVQDLLGEASGGTLDERVKRVLSGTTLEDADWVYQAIRLAKPGGLGRADVHDVREAPDVTLRDAMQAVAERDRIAYLYTTDFSDIFEYGVPRFTELYGRWGDEGWAATGLYLEWLTRVPDSHIVRKHGLTAARWVAARAAGLWERLQSRTYPQGLLKELYALDDEFKQVGVNPGTTADMTVASALAVELEQLCGSGRQTGPGLDRGDRETRRLRDATF
ncbi:MAG: triphosphoribosyl-dephospho-CoA synthase [Gammaproteobacteria bacterium]|nr:triphosphoribosyl-dephospho-CoA synthase [Gammaproteobacteria bacterium]